MTSATPLWSGERVLRILHPCLEPLADAAPLGEARLIDRQRLAVLLQAAGLLSLLDHAGRRLVDWGAARADPDGRLTVVATAIEPGRPRQAQEVLRALLDSLFGIMDGRVSGKGEGRRAARTLGESWRQSLVPLSPDDAVGQILAAAPFLWETPYAAARAALGGTLHVAGREDGGRIVLWAAGAPPFRRRLLAGCPDSGALAARLAAPAAQEYWEGVEDGDPLELTAAGRWRAAAAAWARRPPRGEVERLAMARALAALGRFEAALAALAGLSSGAALVLRAECQELIGQPGAARKTMERSSKTALSPEETVRLAETAARVFAKLHMPQRARLWVRRALAAAQEPPVALEAWLVAATGSWDRGDWRGMEAALEAARPAAGDPGLAWRWHHACALLALGRDADGAAAGRHATLALRAGRRTLPRHRAAGLWNDLGLARAATGDLPGAERAFRHSHRLFAGCDGPRGDHLALSNLAEIRLRRGRPAGVREILDRVTAEDRRAGNLKSLVQDLELQARCELLEGRPEAALAICREAEELAKSSSHGWRQAELHLLSARALGWLGRSAEAAAALDAVGSAAQLPLGELEPEERPALHALAGRMEEARAAAAALADPALRSLWAALLDGRIPTAEWDALASLEPYRAARLVADAERIVPGAAPPDTLRRAAAVLREMGAASLAAFLEARDLGPWQALSAYCATPPSPAGVPTGLAALLAAAGYPEARVVHEGEHGTHVVVPGPGGEAELALPLPGAAGGRIVAKARRADPPLAALLALAARDLVSREASEALPLRTEPAERGVFRGGGGIVGESTALRAALERLDQFAAADFSLIILGESGTGKELAARRVHRNSPRSRGPFVAVNCAALSESLILSDLFGHTRGAFTGAVQDHAGVFQTGDRGTVFLDEIGDLPLTAQGMLLRVLQEGEVRRVGESTGRKVDVRVVAATHRDLTAMIAEKTFRQDLYYRLNGAIAELPPLRDRGADVLLLADHFLSRPGIPAGARLSADARNRLIAYPWPGNVRELENVLRAAAALSGGGTITPEHLALPAAEGPARTFYHREVDDVRRRKITQTLADCGGNRARAARSLGMSRQGLAYLLRKFSLG